MALLPALARAFAPTSRRAAFASRSAAALFAEKQVPMTLLTGSSSPVLTVSTAQRSADALPNWAGPRKVKMVERVTQTEHLGECSSPLKGSVDQIHVKPSPTGDNSPPTYV